MMRNYKLASNFNVVEFTPTEKDLLEMLEPDEIVFQDEEGSVFHEVPEETLLARLLQREYNIINSIKTAPQNANKPVERPRNKEQEYEPVDPPSKKQIEYAKLLGMKDAEKHSKKEVWEFIKRHKG